jgi:hypothetical protein
MTPFRFARPLPAALACLAVLATGPANAQSPASAPGATTTSAYAGATYRFSADIDGGGDADALGLVAGATIAHQVNRQFNIGLTLRYGFEDWSFSDPVAFGGVAPWDKIHRPGINVPMTWAFDPTLRLFVNPSIEWAYEQGASTGDAENYGAFVGMSKTFSPDLTLGLGAGVFREMGETEVFPLVIVDWKFAPGWRLGNPLPVGPSGGAGLEVAYAWNDRWEFGLAGAFREYRFRLDRDGPFPNGIGEHREIPLVLRATWRVDRGTNVDFFAGAALSGRLRVSDRDDNHLVTEDIDPAPVVGVAIRARF